jgi:hypothetical protein
LLLSHSPDEQKEMPGLSLLDVAVGKGKLPRDAVFGAIFVRTAVSLDKPGLNLTHRWVRFGDWKLIVDEEKKGAVELYNVKVDPFEEKDLAGQSAETLMRLRRQLDEWWKGR